MEPDFLLKLGATAITVGTAAGGITMALLKNTFITRKEFKDHKKECEGDICTKMDDIKNLVTEADKKRENAIEKQQERDEKLFIFMGEVKQYMREHSIP